MNPTIAIIGAGEIGSRHLQALALIDRPINVYVVDVNHDSLLKAKERFLEVSTNRVTYVPKVNFLTDISNLPVFLDVTIIATNSDIRHTVIKQLLYNTTVNCLIIEKFLFQSLVDYKEIGELFKKKNIKAWVNCPRRLWKFYYNLKLKLSECRSIELNVTGSNWGLGCNSIHFLDLIAYFTGDQDFNLYSDKLDDKIVPSKRKRFIEFTGTLYGQSVNGNRILLTSNHDNNDPLTVKVISDKVHYVVREGEKKAWIAEETNKWHFNEVRFDFNHQSELTHLVVQRLLDNGQCNLPGYEESSHLHKAIMKPFLTHLKNLTGRDATQCPIT
ncbi:MAG: hypothetical protein FH756_09020 [Firmicutes bacterium]|nr:hypothetical protein [Bacillota bacterium]